MKPPLAIIRTYWIIITALLLTLITVLSLYPLESLPSVPGSDKTHHFIAYGALIFPAALRKPNYLLWIALGFISWSAAIELIQPFVNRYGEWLDLLANTVGLGCGFLLAQLINRIMPAKTEVM